MFGAKLEATDVTATATIDFPQLGLQMQAPDLRVVGQLIAVQRQAFNNRVEDGFSGERTMERALGFDG